MMTMITMTTTSGNSDHDHVALCIVGRVHFLRYFLEVLVVYVLFLFGSWSFLSFFYFHVDFVFKL